MLRLFLVTAKNHLLGGVTRNAFKLSDTEPEMLTGKDIMKNDIVDVGRATVLQETALPVLANHLFFRKQHCRC